MANYQLELENSKRKLSPFILPGTLASFTILSGLILSAPASRAESVGNVSMSVEVSSACSLTVNPTTHSVTINPGNSATIGTSTIKSICNDPAGLAVYAAGFTNDTYGNTNLASTIGGNTYNIPTDVVASPTTSQWNMTLTAVSGDYAPTIMNQTTGDNPVGNFTIPHVIPSVYTKVAYRNSMTDIGTGATGANFTATFNAYVSPAQPAGTYTGKVKFLLVHPNVLSWREDPEHPGEMIPDEEIPDAPSYDPEDPPLFLQNVATWGRTVALGETVEAVDNRDGQTYKVKRLKMNSDGSETALWMSNLNIGAIPLTTDITPSNTHTNTTVTASTFNSWIKSSGTYSYTNPELIPITASNSATGSDADSYGNKYGTLYNYAAASAGTFVYPKGTEPTDAEYDLCPFGWRLPTDNSEGEFRKLVVSGYGIVIEDYGGGPWNTDGFTTMESTLGFSRAGSISASTNTPAGQGSRGYYWSSTRWPGRDSLEPNMYYMMYTQQYGFMWDVSTYRDEHQSVRCIAQ